MIRIPDKPDVICIAKAIKMHTAYPVAGPVHLRQDAHESSYGSMHGRETEKTSQERSRSDPRRP